MQAHTHRPIGHNCPWPSIVPSRQSTVLFVDDETDIRDLAATVLTAKGYSVIKASNGREALEIYRSSQQNIDLVVLDMVMPGMSGLQCLRELIKINPRVKAIIGSGDPDSLLVDEAGVHHVKAFLPKPFGVKQLTETVRDVLAES